MAARKSKLKEWINESSPRAKEKEEPERERLHQSNAHQSNGSYSQTNERGVKDFGEAYNTDTTTNKDERKEEKYSTEAQIESQKDLRKT